MKWESLTAAAKELARAEARAAATAARLGLRTAVAKAAKLVAALEVRSAAVLVRGSVATSGPASVAG